MTAPALQLKLKLADEPQRRRGLTSHVLILACLDPTIIKNRAVWHSEVIAQGVVRHNVGTLMSDHKRQ